MIWVSGSDGSVAECADDAAVSVAVQALHDAGLVPVEISTTAPTSLVGRAEATELAAQVAAADPNLAIPRELYDAAEAAIATRRDP